MKAFDLGYFLKKVKVLYMAACAQHRDSPFG